MEPTLVNELTLDFEEAGLGVVDEDEARRADPGDLAAELGADRASCARDENHLAREITRDGVDVHVDRLAAEQVLDLHRADLPGQVEVAGDQLGRPERVHRYVLRASDLDDALADLPMPTGWR